MRIGVSVGSHYRVLRAESDIESLLQYLVSKRPSVIELGLHDNRTYDLYFQSYLRSACLREALLDSQPLRMHLHLPRKDWDLLGVKRVIRDIERLDANVPLAHLIIHHSDYCKYGSQFGQYASRLLVENEVMPHASIKNVPAWACDISHFLAGGSFDQGAFDLFLRTYGTKIKEFHFAWGNHDLFSHDSLAWLRRTVTKIRIAVPRDVVFVFEGTDKNAINVTALQHSLDGAFAMIGETPWST